MPDDNPADHRTMRRNAEGQRLILSVERPQPMPGPLGWLPLNFFDLGHVEIVLWKPSSHARCYGFYVSPTTTWRVLGSIFRRQRARMVRSAHPPDRATYWRAWTLPPGGYDRTLEFLEQKARGCTAGSVRYHGLRHNCFHLALECLATAGIEVPPVQRQLHFIFPTLGARAFLRHLLPGIQPSSLATDLTRGSRATKR